jgi:hypothetical protein
MNQQLWRHEVEEKFYLGVGGFTSDDIMLPARIVRLVCNKPVTGMSTSRRPRCYAANLTVTCVPTV